MNIKENENFNFPFKPYDIQLKFMQTLYQVLEDGKIGIFESPTGTGKSLSLICGALTWLRHFEKQKVDEMEATIKEKQTSGKDDTGIDWFESFAKRKEDNAKIDDVRVKLDRYKKREERIGKMRERRLVRETVPPKDCEFDDLFKDAREIRDAVAMAMKDKSSQELEDDEWVLDDFNSDDEESRKIEEENCDDEEDEFVTRIYYCSRTHSQLSQFVREIQKTAFSDIRLASLASRQSTCVNESVVKLNSLSLINDQCLNLQKTKKGKSTKFDVDDGCSVKKKKQSQGCPFYKSNLVDRVRDEILTSILDIEQVVKIGRKKTGCPYYASRRAAIYAQLVVLPYNTLLHKPTRKSSGIRLKNSIVIIDEAHNLAEAITNMHSVEVTGAQLLKAHSQLQQYRERYKNRLKAKNMLYIGQLLFILNGFIKVLAGGFPAVNVEKTSGTKLMSLGDFLEKCNVEHMNFFKIVAFCEVTEIAKKLRGFVENYEVTIHQKTNNSGNQTTKSTATAAPSSVSQFLQKLCQDSSKKGGKPTEPLIESKSTNNNIIPSSPLNQIKEFLQALTSIEKDGRVVIKLSENVQKSSLKFLLLNPSSHLKDIVTETRAVVVAGGTMQPTSEFIEQLFVPAGTNPLSIIQFSCGHVIPDDHLLAMAIEKGPSGLELNFSYQNRQSNQMIDELGRIISNVCNIVPGGIVCFFPSYDYAGLVCERWETIGTMRMIEKKKSVFKEPKASSLTDQVLANYTKAIQRSVDGTELNLTGAILFSVVGGKMSEGINFSDDLGRCVVMVGMPYPNRNSPELKEKMDFLNSSMPKSPTGQLPGQVYYENLCMKAVNQSIGRAIRHKDDYSAILLADSRYCRPQVQGNLPDWIRSRIQNGGTFGFTFAMLRKFFCSKRTSRQD